MKALEEATIEMDASIAREKVAEYLKSVRERHNEEDAAILRGYKALAKGHALIDLPKCIRLGGAFEENGLPRIAVATSSHDFVYAKRPTRWNAAMQNYESDGSIEFRPLGQWRFNPRRTKDVYRVPAGTLPEELQCNIQRNRRFNNAHPWDGDYRAMVPIVPPGLRPAHSLDGYATLFEVEEWALDPAAPADPALLKHIGGDLYAVIATWNLTELERAVIAGRTR